MKFPAFSFRICILFDFDYPSFGPCWSLGDRMWRAAQRCRWECFYSSLTGPDRIGQHRGFELSVYGILQHHLLNINNGASTSTRPTSSGIRPAQLYPPHVTFLSVLFCGWASYSLRRRSRPLRNLSMRPTCALLVLQLPPPTSSLGLQGIWFGTFGYIIMPPLVLSYAYMP